MLLVIFELLIAISGAILLKQELWNEATYDSLYYNYDIANPISTIEISQTPNIVINAISQSYLYDVSVNGRISGTTHYGEPLTKVPNFATGSFSPQTLIVPVGTFITSIQVCRETDMNFSYFLSRIELTFSDNTRQEILRASYVPSNFCSPAMNAPSGFRFVGFQAGVEYAKVAYNVQAFWLLYEDCVSPNDITLDLSPIVVLSKQILVDGVSTQSFAFVDNHSGWCGSIEFSILVVTKPVGASASLITLPTASQSQIQFGSSTSLADKGDQTITVRAGYGSPPTNWIATATFTFTYVDPCSSTVLNQPLIAPTNMITSVLVAATQTIGIFQDSISLAHGSGSGVDICGARSYQISASGPSLLSASELNIHVVTGLVTLLPASNAKVGTYTVTVLNRLYYYSSIFSTVTFTITIELCVITSFNTSPTTPIGDKIYYLGDSPLALSYPASSLITQVPACGYVVETRSTTSSTAYFQVTPGATIQFNLSTRDFANIQVKNVETSTVIVNYPYTSNPFVNTQSFTLTIADPCPQSVITGPTSVETIVVFAGYSKLTELAYIYNDTQSQIRTLTTDLDDFCGEKEYLFTLDRSTTTVFSLEKNGQIKFSPPLGSSKIGITQAQLVVQLKKYPAVQSPTMTFAVSVLNSEVPSISDVEYKIQDTKLIIDLKSFLILPQIVANTLQLSYSTSVFMNVAGSVLPSHIDLKCSCLQTIEQYDWITFVANQLEVYSSDNAIAGVYQLVIVYQVEQFAEVQPYTTFKLYIQELITNINLTPSTKLVVIDVVLGQPAQVVPLRKFYTFPILRTQYTFSFSFNQVEGQNITSVEIDSSFSFVISATENSLAGTQANFQIVATTDLPDQVPNDQLNIKVNFKLPKIKNTSSVNTQFNKTSIDKKNSTLFMPPGFKPVWIADVTQTGVLKIKFYRAIFVPNFTISSNDSTLNTSARQLNQVSNITLEQYITNDTIDISIKTFEGVERVNWKCSNLEETILTIQLFFEKPIEISTQRTDLLTVKILNPDLFILQTKTNYLIQEQSQQTLTFGVPPQFSSAATLAVFNSIAEASKQVGTGMIVSTLVIQIVAKKVITFMWVYYSALQIILIVNRKSNIQMPASVQTIVKEIDGIVNLSSFDKKAAAEKLKLDSLFKEGGILDSLGGVSLAIIGIVLLILLLVVLRFACRHPKVVAIVQKVKEFLFWNFLIRYFQASYLNFNFSALYLIFNPSLTDPMSLATSGIILVIQFLVVGLILYKLLRLPLYQFQSDATKKSIGNLYSSLDSSERQNVTFGIMFYIQRSFVAVILAAQISGGLQWSLLTFVFLANSVYLFLIQPYNNLIDGVPDYMNNIIILIFATFQAGLLSQWISDSEQRFLNGICFDGFLGLCMVVNFGFVIVATSGSTVLRIKRAIFRCKNREKIKQRQRAKRINTARFNSKQTYKIENLTQQKSQPVHKTYSQMWLQYANDLHIRNYQAEDDAFGGNQPMKRHEPVLQNRSQQQLASLVASNTKAERRKETVVDLYQQDLASKLQRPSNPPQQMQRPRLPKVEVPKNFPVNSSQLVYEERSPFEYTFSNEHNIVEAKFLQEKPTTISKIRPDLQQSVMKTQSVSDYYDLWEYAQQSNYMDVKAMQKHILIQKYKKTYPECPPKPDCFTIQEYYSILEEAKPQASKSLFDSRQMQAYFR